MFKRFLEDGEVWLWLSCRWPTEGYCVQMRTSSKLLEKGAAGTSALPCCNGIFQPDGGKQPCFIFKECFQPSYARSRVRMQAKASICRKKEGCIQPPTAASGQGNCWGEMVSRQLTLSAVFIIASL